MEEDELNALLGKNLNLSELAKSLSSQPKSELAKIEPDKLEEKILEESNEIIGQTKNALADVLMQLQTTPNDGELVEGAAKMVNAFSGLLDSLHKIYSMKERFRQQVVLQAARMQAADKMNQDNNATKVLLTREQIMSTLENNAKNNTFVDLQEQQENETPKLQGLNDILKNESDTITQEI